jgi:hypothetical protein
MPAFDHAVVSASVIPSTEGWVAAIGWLIFICLVAAWIYSLVDHRINLDDHNGPVIEADSEIETFENAYSGDNLKDPMIAAMETVENILVHHSGPFASNCIIGSRYRQVNDVDEFTKDGINILKHVLVSEDVSARVVIRLARFVGIAVDSRCHDGTTTSMLMFSALAKVAIEKINESHMSPERHQWTDDLKAALDECLKLVSELKVTEDDILELCGTLGIETSITDVRASIAYHMSMISSKGDHDLSTKISEIIRSSPKKIYGMYRNIPLAIETEEAYILKQQEHDLGTRANLGHMDHFNHRNNTQYLSEDAVIFATGNVISVESMEAGFLQAFISTRVTSRADLSTFGMDKGWESFHEGKRHLIIISPMLDDPNLIQTINNFNGNNPSIKISWFNFHIDHKLRTSFNKTLHYMAGVPLFDDTMFVNAGASLIGLGETRVKVQMIGSHLAISHLYKRDGEVFHPLYRDPEAFKPYTDFRRETEEIIQFAQENITNPTLDQNELGMMTSLYRSLTCQLIYDIEVGGSKHDQRANQTVYEDAIGAALSAVDEGVILGGYAHLANYFSELAEKDGDLVSGMFADAFRKVVMDSLRVTDEDSADNLLDRLPSNKWYYLVADRASYGPDVDANDYVSCLCLGYKHGMTAFLERRPDHAVLLQAYGGYHEQFKRFRDILPKLSNTSHLIDMRNDKDVANVV